MKILNRIIIIILFLASFIAPSAANEKVAFVNIDFLIQNSNFGKRVLDKIEKQNNKNIEQLEKKNKFLKDLELEIKNKKNLISENDFNKEVLSFQKKVKDFTNEKNILVKNFNELKKKEIENVFKLLNPILSSYMEENSISIILDSKNIFMGNVESNLTNAILIKVNNELK